MNETEIVAALNAYVDAHADTILAETQAILRIPSLRDEVTATDGAPFGRDIADALTHTLGLCERLGMATENFAGYAGHADINPNIGDTAEIVAMLGHLDVVPEGNGWTFDPWGATVADNGFIYGRGTSDDKGPTYAALFGAKAVLDVCAANDIELSRRVRLIFGCDEESEWRCMDHYFGAAAQPKPTLAFTPDAGFPLVHAEKGSFTAHATRRRDRTQAPADAPHLVMFESGLRANMVPDQATALVACASADPMRSIMAMLVAMPNITVETVSDTGIVVRARGKGAHASTPQEGDNAAVRLMRALTDVGVHDAWLTDLADRAGGDGMRIGIGGSDAVTGALTSNLGIVNLPADENIVTATFNVRYPATWDGEETIARLRASLAETNWTVEEKMRFTPPLYVPLDQEPVKTLLRIYREQTGDYDTPPGTMGGRTYATSVAPVGVAFGAAMPGDPHVAHEADERFAVERLLQCAKIYAHALYALAK